MNVQQLRPSKPSPDLPLSITNTGQWAKKVKGRRYYFGAVSRDPRGERTIAEWLRRKPFIEAGAPAEPDLSIVALVSPTLPLAIKAGIVAMVKVATQR